MGKGKGNASHMFLSLLPQLIINDLHFPTFRSVASLLRFTRG
jgi:hypothetical protein